MVLTKIQKYDIIIKHNNGMTIREIAKLLKINKNSVTLWLDRYKNNGT